MFTQPEQYQTELTSKAERLQAMLAPYTKLPLKVFESTPEYYRMRAEFKIWHDGDKAHYAMFEQGTNKPILIEHFPVANQHINTLMPKLLDKINDSEILKRKLFHVEFLSTTTGSMLVSMIYHKQIDEIWCEEAKALETLFDIHIIGRARKIKHVLSQDSVNEIMTVDGEQYHYQQIEGGFTQPNAGVCAQMLSWAKNVSTGHDRDFLELYCGNGNFTMPLARQYRKALATEMAKPSIKACLVNAEANGIDNLSIARLAAEEFTQAWTKVRPFRRLKDIDLDSYDFGTVLVDPPRAGLDSGTEQLVQNFDQIIYVSCNPETLVSNLEVLTKTHTIEAVALFDQFPYTHHMEAGVSLIRKAD